MKKIINNTKISAMGSLVMGILLLYGCSSDDPQREDVPELITKVTLTFTPAGGGTAVVATATDPDGEGVQNLAADGEISLAFDKTYTLAIGLVNGLADPADPAYDVTEEVREEGVEHFFFFSWTNDVFSDPAGNGNMDNRDDAVNYSGGSDSKDVNGLPLGLTTTWTSAPAAASGTFRVVLKHQPGLKSATSDSNTGETDTDVSFTIKIQ